MKTIVNGVQVGNEAAPYHLAMGSEVIIEDRYVARLKTLDGETNVTAPNGSLLAEGVSIPEGVQVAQAFAQLCYIPEHDTGDKQYLHTMDEPPTIHEIGTERYIGVPQQCKVAKVQTDYLGPFILVAA